VLKIALSTFVLVFLAELGATQCARLREMVYTPGGPGSCAPLVEKAATILLQLLAGAERVNSRC